MAWPSDTDTLNSKQPEVVGVKNGVMVFALMFCTVAPAVWVRQR
jgi:hypothetical protein